MYVPDLDELWLILVLLSTFNVLWRWSPELQVWRAHVLPQCLLLELLEWCLAGWPRWAGHLRDNLSCRCSLLLQRLILHSSQRLARSRSKLLLRGQLLPWRQVLSASCYCSCTTPITLNRRDDWTLLLLLLKAHHYLLRLIGRFGICKPIRLLLLMLPDWRRCAPLIDLQGARRLLRTEAFFYHRGTGQSERLTRIWDAQLVRIIVRFSKLVDCAWQRDGHQFDRMSSSWSCGSGLLPYLSDWVLGQRTAVVAVILDGCRSLFLFSKATWIHKSCFWSLSFLKACGCLRLVRAPIVFL